MGAVWTQIGEAPLSREQGSRTVKRMTLAWLVRVFTASYAIALALAGYPDVGLLTGLGLFIVLERLPAFLGGMPKSRRSRSSPAPARSP